MKKLKLVSPATEWFWMLWFLDFCDLATLYKALDISHFPPIYAGQEVAEDETRERAKGIVTNAFRNIACAVYHDRDNYFWRIFRSLKAAYVRDYPNDPKPPKGPRYVN